MFKLVKDPVAPWPVEWRGVGSDGEIVTLKITLFFVRVGRDEFNALFAAGGDQDAAQELAMFQRLVRSWDGIADDDGAPLPFTADNATRLLDYPGFADAFGRVYVNYWLAQPKEREKNSDPSPAGPAVAADQTGGAAASAKGLGRR